MKRKAIFLTKEEQQCGLDRQRWAELLILQLPKNHDGRNSWLLNFGVGDEAKAFRAKHNVEFKPLKMAVWD